MAAHSSRDDVIGAPMLDKSEGICVCSVDCRKRFERSIQILKEISPSEANDHGYDRELSTFAMQNTFTHFKVWGNSIAAFQNAVVRSSLEFHLKEASEIQQRVLKVLGNLQVSLYEESEQTSELQELFKAMKDANTNLLKLSMVIRSSPNRDDYLKAATRCRLDASYDISHVREKHGSAKRIADWLIVRLGKAITRRRQYLKYREDHHGKLTRNWDDVAIFEKEDKAVALTKATTFVENTTPAKNDGSELGGSFGSQTSYGATIGGGRTCRKIVCTITSKIGIRGCTLRIW
ncbi:hypothetical protein OCU04_007136 [Sclerotinia nivalis]|uniref:Uncharacterized protein n=1 Tax=Sclerotinia nivalis TaxID=352851 RepID=A0A9X0APP3_9HELO|nr:hypothetical protein OCU04_007136 [Sclerotinia nivalis]